MIIWWFSCLVVWWFGCLVVWLLVIGGVETPPHKEGLRCPRKACAARGSITTAWGSDCCYAVAGLGIGVAVIYYRSHVVLRPCYEAVDYG